MGNEESGRSVVEHGVRTSVRNNVAAYGFSVMITAAFGVLSATLGSPKVGEVFIYAGGAVAGVTLIEGAASRGFRVRLRGEPSDVIALGSSFSFASVGLAVGAAALSGAILGSWVGWLVGPLLASSTYVVASGIEMALAHEAQKRRQAEQDES
ncbi:MAG TPA: hypothetical protein VFG58_05020 [Solirubrobacterales bacterium]|nr:hypothetical protein [Solirubrobacterales bacterium]